MAQAALYSDRMQSLFGFSGSNSTADNPVRNIRKSTESLMNIEQDQLDSSHDAQDLLEDQIKLLKRIAKATEKYGRAANSNSAGGLVGDALGAYLGSRGGRAGKAVAAAEGAAAEGLIKRASRSALNWTKSMTGHIGTAFTKSGTFFKNASGGIFKAMRGHIGSFTSTLIGSAGSLLKGMGSILSSGVRFAGKLFTRVVAPAMAAYGAYQGYQASKTVDPQGKTGFQGRANATIAGGVDGLTGGIGSMITQMLYGQDFATTTATGDAKMQKLKDDYRAKGGKTIGDYVSSWFSAPAEKTSSMLAGGTATQTVAQRISAGQHAKAIVDAVKNSDSSNKSSAQLEREAQLQYAANNIAKAAANRAHMDAGEIVKAASGGLSGALAAFNGSGVPIGDQNAPANGFEPTAAMKAAAASHDTSSPVPGSMSATDPNTVFKPGAIIQHPSITQAANIGGTTTPDSFSTFNVDAPAMSGNNGTTTNIKVRSSGNAGGSSALTNKNGRVISTADTSLQPNQRALLDTLAGGESKDYTTIVGGQTFSDFSKHPNVRVRQKDGSISTAAGRYQFTNSTWKDTIAKYNTNNPSDPITDFSPASQDKAALFLANQDYKRRSGRDLQADLNSGMPMGQNLKDGLGGHGRDTTWQSLQNPSAGSLDAAFTSNLSRNLSYGTTGNKIPDVGSGIVGTSLPGASLRGSRLSVVDNAAKNGIQNTDPRLKAILDEASKGLPDGYRAELYSGFRPGDTRNHGKGMADDIRIIDKDGKTLPNYQSPETFRTYEKFAQSARKAQMSLYPDLKDSFRWGGYLTGGAKDPFKGYGASDQMHFDLDGKHGMGAGSWENGLNNKFKGIFDTASNPSMGLGDISSYGPSSAVSALSTKVKLQSIANNPLFTPSSTPSAFSTAVGPSQDELNQTGIALGKGIVQAQQNTPNIPTFDPTSINSSVTNAVDSAPAGTPAAKTAPKGDTAPTNGPNIDSIPHTDELSMMMANSQMMA